MNKYKKPIYAIREDSNDSNSNKSDDEKQEKQLWCICRSDDGSRFMICCDNCEEWYHGDCVNITPKQAESISKYFCAQCQKRYPHLKFQYKLGAIKKSKDIPTISKTDKSSKLQSEERPVDHKIEKSYKNKLDDRLSESTHVKNEKFKIKSEYILYDQSQSKYEKQIGFSKADDRSMELTMPVKSERHFGKTKYSDDRFSESVQMKYDNKHYMKPKSNIVDKQLDVLQKDSSNSSNTFNSKFDKQGRVKVEEKITEPLIKFSQKPQIKPGCCGECIGCLRKVDCNFCQNCKTKSDKGCLKRMCEMIKPNTVEKIARPEKVMLTKLPGDFIPTKSVPPKKTQAFVSSTTRNNLPTIQKTTLPTSSSSSSNEIISKPLKRNLSPSTSSGSDSLNKLSSMKKSKHEPELNVVQAHAKSKFMESSESSEEDMDEDEEIEDDDMEDESDDDSDNEESNDSFVERKMTKATSKIPHRTFNKKSSHKFNENAPPGSVSPVCTKSKFRRKKPQTNRPECVKNYKPLECHNINCTKPSRVGSKYCSDDCGVRLAEQRLLKYLPSRITNWNNSLSISTQRDRRTQAEIKEECETIQYNLNILDKSHHDLIEFIDRWRSSCTASSNPDDDDRRPPGAIDDSVQCVTCGTMFPSTRVLAHMENCYQKIEGGTMVFADFEEQPIGSKLFCDFYDSNIRGYCKRLAALCDHNKDTKVDPKTICAFPLSVNEKSDKVCMTAKIKCNRHVNWERIQRAVIDMNRYRLLVRYEELQVEDRKFKNNIAQRGGVMQLLLHETIDHQPMKPLVPLRNLDRNKKMRKFTKAVCI